MNISKKRTAVICVLIVMMLLALAAAFGTGLSMQSAFAAAAENTTSTTAKTIRIFKDNESNKHNGKPDGDMGVDSTAISYKSRKAPIEVRIDLSKEQVPKESATLVIHCNSEKIIIAGGFKATHEIYVNDQHVGYITGWATVLELPMGLLKEGANYVEIRLDKSKGPLGVPVYFVHPYSMQLLIDGGDPEHADFSATLGKPMGTQDNPVLPLTYSVTSGGGIL